MLLPYSKVGLGHVEVGHDQRGPSLKALETYVWVQRTDPPLRKTVNIWTWICVYFCQHVF